MADRYWRDAQNVVHVVDATYNGMSLPTVCGITVPHFTAGRFMISDPFEEDVPITCIACAGKRKYAR
jgi:hypothetical protein